VNSVAAVARASAEQAAMSEQIARAVEDMRGRAREISTTTAQQARGTANTAGEVREVASRLTQLSRMQGEQAEQLTRLSTLLGGSWMPEGKPIRPREQA
jgi:methyl-accepting chemotaxis protein